MSGSSIAVLIVVIIALVVVGGVIYAYSSESFERNPTTTRATDSGSNSQPSNTQPLTYEKKQTCKQVKVPYEVTENYEEYLSAQIVSKTTDTDLTWDGIVVDGVVGLKNTDNEAGWFNMVFNWKTLHDDDKYTVRHFIEPDETVIFTHRYDIDAGEDYDLSVTFKSDPQPRTRTVTKYRTEEVCA